MCVTQSVTFCVTLQCAAVSCRSWPLVQLTSPTNPARAPAHHPHDACATMADRTRAAVRQDPLQGRARRAGPLCKRSTVGAQHWLGADDGPSRGVDVAPHLPVGLGSSLRPSACGARRPSTTSAALRVSQRRSPPPASQRLLHTRAESGLGVGSCPRLALRAAWSWLPPSRMCTSSRRSSRSSTSRDAGQDYGAPVACVYGRK